MNTYFDVQVGHDAIFQFGLPLSDESQWRNDKCGFADIFEVGFPAGGGGRFGFSVANDQGNGLQCFAQT